MSNLISSILPKILERATGNPVGALNIRRLGGGSINETFEVITHDRRHWFCKINATEGFPDLFQRESEGLAILRSHDIIRIPEVIACTATQTRQFLILEWIEPGAAGPIFWKEFGERLARLHHVTAPHFGLDTPNYMGALPQSNNPQSDWNQFFITQRLQPQVALAAGKGLLCSSAITRFERLYQALPGIFPESEPPSLLHGDLWSGNFICDRDSRPVLVDPAVYFGHRSIDLAMTTLFGGFQKEFYEAYDYYYPFPPEYRRQWDICNLYPLLIHLNLFGRSPSSGGPLPPSSAGLRNTTPLCSSPAPFVKNSDAFAPKNQEFGGLGYLADILRTIQPF